MVNFKSAVTFGLIASTATAASLHKDKRHVHHRRAKAPCTTSVIETAPFPVGNATVPAGTGAVSTSTIDATTSSQAVVTYTVVPVPVNPTSGAGTGSTSTVAEASSSAAVSNGGSGSGSSPNTSVAGGAPVPAPSGGSGSPSQPAGNGGSACGAATSYVTVQQTVTVTAGQVPEVTSSSTSVAAVVPSSSVTPAAAQTTEQPAAPALLQTAGHGHKHSTTAVEAPIPESSTTAQAPVEQPTFTSSAPATSSSAASSSGGSASCVGGGKLGVAWDPWQGGVANLFSGLGATGACWAYDWAPSNSGGTGSGVEYVPCLHDGDKAAGFKNDLEGQAGVSWVKHLNEPDVKGSGGCNLSPGAAASLHKEHIAGLQGQYKIGLPSVSAEDAALGFSGTGFPAGIQWLEAFIDQAGCDFAFADAHWYGGAGQSVDDQAKYFLAYIDEFASRLDKKCPQANFPIWVTELSTAVSSDNAAFMAIVAPALDKNNRVARYSSWPGNNNAISNLMSSVVSVIESLV